MGVSFIDFTWAPQSWMFIFNLPVFRACLSAKQCCVHTVLMAVSNVGGKSGMPTQFIVCDRLPAIPGSSPLSAVSPLSFNLYYSLTEDVM